MCSHKQYATPVRCNLILCSFVMSVFMRFFGFVDRSQNVRTRGNHSGPVPRKKINTFKQTHRSAAPTRRSAENLFRESTANSGRRPKRCCYICISELVSIHSGYYGLFWIGGTFPRSEYYHMAAWRRKSDRIVSNLERRSRHNVHVIGIYATKNTEKHCNTLNNPHIMSLVFHVVLGL